MNCPNCNKKFPYKSNKKFCSTTCRTRFNARRYWKKHGSPWKKKNPKKYRETLLKYYYKNKPKCICRTMTYQIFISEGNTCFNCGVDGKLQIHHEIYPNTYKEIKKAIANERIYRICKKCHKCKHLNTSSSS